MYHALFFIINIGLGSNSVNDNVKYFREIFKTHTKL